MPSSGDTDPDFIGFLGVWTDGDWGGMMPHALVVERVGRDDASVIYSRGAVPVWGVPDTRWFRHTATVDRVKKQLTIKFPSGGVVSYWLTDGGLGAVYSREWATTHFLTYHAELKKFDPWKNNTPPLPSDLRIEQLNGDAKGLPDRMWRGSWGEVLPHIFVVERINGAVAQIVYAHGTAPHWKFPEGKWHRLQGTYDEATRKIHVSLPSGVEVVYTIQPNGVLSGVATTKSGAKSFGLFVPSNGTVGKAAN